MTNNSYKPLEKKVIWLRCWTKLLAIIYTDKVSSDRHRYAKKVNYLNVYKSQCKNVMLPTYVSKLEMKQANDAMCCH